MRLEHLVRIIRQVRSLPEVEVRMWGGEAARSMHASFTRPHPKYRLIQSKRWGAALLPLPGTFEEYLGGAARSYLRRKRNHALSRGYRFGTFAPLERLDEILDINLSKQVRQGQTMRSDYLDRDDLRAYFRDKERIRGVLDEGGVLRAYAYTPVLGEVFVFDRLLGHARHLEEGIMYLLVSETIREMIERKAERGFPAWAMYDTILGAHPGLRFFKEQLGFRPYKVRWTLLPDTDEVLKR